MDADEIRYAAGAIRDAEVAVAMSGAGVSTASGIPDFRGDDGLWQTHDPRDFHVDRFEADPAGFWEDIRGLRESIYADDVSPNPAHEALADLEAGGHLDAVITQNIDGLHQAAGSEDVIEVHGNDDRAVCRSCHQRFDASSVYDRGELPPRCDECDGVLKPDTVLFGEQLPEHALFRAHALAERSDVFLVVGSSLTVEPAASFPETAADRGATVVIVNLDRTPLSDRAEYDFRADVTEALPVLGDAVLDGR